MQVCLKGMIKGAAACVANTLILMHIAHAQSQPAEAGILDNAAIVTLIGENSSVSTAKLTDRYYTNGMALRYLSGEGAFETLDRLVHPLFGDGAARLSVGITQQLYTPATTEIVVPPATDRPYAGVLLANLAAVQDAMNMRSSVGLNVGMIGPSALGQTVQNGWHDLIGQGVNHGWHSQLHDEPVFAFTAARVWRVNTGRVGGLETDVLPGAGVSLGTLRSDAEAGLSLRIGEGLARDFGVPRVRALSGGEGFHGGDAMSWYAFAGLAGQAVGNDVTLNGNYLRPSNRVKLNPFVADAQLGLALVTGAMRVSYTHILQSQEFEHQKGGPHQFGALALSMRF